MSGEAGGRKRRALTSEEVQAFFGRIEAMERCPICGNDHWYMATDDKYRHFIPTIASAPGEQTGVSVYVMICSRCGFVRQHFSGIVEAAADRAADETEQT